MRMLRVLIGTPLDSPQCLQCILLRNTSSFLNDSWWASSTMKKNLDHTTLPIVQYNGCYGYMFHIPLNAIRGFARQRFDLRCIGQLKNPHKQRIDSEMTCASHGGRITLTRLNRCWDKTNKINFAMYPFSAASLLLNGMIIAVTATTSSLRSNAMMFLMGNMAFGDFCFTLSLLLMTIAQVSLSFQEYEKLKSTWYCGSFGCTILFSFLLSVGASTLLTAERYLAVVFAMKPDRRLDTKLARKLICSMYLGFFVVAILPYTLLREKYLYNNYCVPIRPLDSKNFSYMAAPMFLAFLYYFSMVPMYLHIYYKVRKSSQQAGRQNTVNYKIIRRVFLISFSNIVLAIVPAFVHNWTSDTEWFQDKFGANDTNEAKQIAGATYVYICFAMNASVNSLLYAYRNEKFLNALKRKLGVRDNRVLAVRTGAPRI
ncbi:thyrotropin receptor isoform X2 [Nematostella vectensis]|nr:thyrotropin receptor isoform X2 [Nematostella vectensis]